MSATELIEQIDKLSLEEQEKIFAFVTAKIIAHASTENKRWLGKELSFEEACDVVFCENRELLSLLAK